MNFSTPITISKSNDLIDYKSKIISLGSCFAENMSSKFDYFKFQNSANPFGIIFNPVSIEKIISRAINNEQFSDNDVFFHNNLWHSYEVHSNLSHENKEKYLKTLNEVLSSFRNQLLNATHVIITYGTSWVYKLRQVQFENNRIVANCHKVPQNQFDKEILSIEIIEKSIKNTIDFIQNINPNCTFIFTVSPVRHSKDGFVENTQSKAHLLSAIHKIRNSKNEKRNLNYFPSFEIMMDELRDYRFYAQDMLHPSQVAIDYIWEKFFTSQISELIYPAMQEVCAIQKALSHKSFNPSSENHIQFLDGLNRKIEIIKSQFSHMQF